MKFSIVCTVVALTVTLLAGQWQVALVWGLVLAYEMRWVRLP